jgi:hypothetical protein
MDIAHHTSKRDSVDQYIINIGSQGKTDHKESPKSKGAREHDHHLSRSGRNDDVKKGGMGKGNWGSPQEEIKQAVMESNK